MELTTLDRFFWAAGLAGHFALFTILVVRKRLAQFPCFSSLVAFNIVRTVTLYYVHDAGAQAYFYSYWSLTLADAVLQLLVFAEVAWQIFGPAGHLSGDTRKPLVMIAVMSLCLAMGIVSLSAPPVKDFDQWIVLRLELLTSVLMSELFAGLSLLSLTSGFVWRTHVGVIARGLGFFSVFSLSLSVLESHVGIAHGPAIFYTLSHLRIVAYLICLAYWNVGLGSKIVKTKPFPSHLERQLARLNAYVNAALGQLRTGGNLS